MSWLRNKINDFQLRALVLGPASYLSVLAYVSGAKKNCLIEMFLLSTHNICCG